MKRCGCIVAFLGFLVAGAIFHKFSMQPHIETSLLQKFVALTKKVQQANGKEKRVLIADFLYKDRADFSRVNLIDPLKKRQFEKLHTLLDDYHLLLEILNGEVTRNVEFLVECLGKTYGKEFLVGPEKPPGDEQKVLEAKIWGTYLKVLGKLQKTQKGDNRNQ